MEGVEAKIELRINEDCLMKFRTRRSGGSHVVRVIVAAAFSCLLSWPATIRSWRAGWWSVFSVLRIDE